MSDLPPAPPRSFVPVVDPTQREVVRRATVRLLVVDPAGRALMFRDSDPNTGRSWWITPGGGIDPGETEVQAALRELEEETGHVADAVDLHGPIGRRHVVHGYSDRIVDQDDVFYLVRAPAFEVSTAGHTPEEQVTMLDHRWWSSADLAATAELVWPANLVDLIDLAGRPADWPVTLPDVEESSVPV